MSTPGHSYPSGDGTRDEDRLSCGRLVEDILAQVAEGNGADHDSHQRRCPHCQAALAEYDRLWAPMREVTAQRVSAPESVVDSALRRIRGAVEHNDYGVLDSEQGLTRIAARVVVVLARETAQGVPGVRVALSKHITEVPPGARTPHPPSALAHNLSTSRRNHPHHERACERTVDAG